MRMRIVLILCSVVSVACGQYVPVMTATNAGMLYYPANTSSLARIPTLTVSNLVVQGDMELASGMTWDDLRVGPVGLNPVGIADAAVLVSDSGSSADQLALRFDASSLRVAAATYQMPHSWASTVNSNVYPHLHISPQGTGTGAVVMVCRYAYSDIGDLHPSSTVVTNTYHITTNTQYRHTLWNLPTNGITMSNMQYSAILDWRFERLGNDGADTYGDAIDVKSADLHYLDRGAPVVYAP